MPRTYVQRARAEAAERTRAEILRAARTALLEGDRLEFSVGDVAAAAGVARSTIYATFTSRAGLLAALSDDVVHGAGLDDVIEAFRLPDPRQALELSLAASCRMYAAEHRLFKRLVLLGEVDPEAAAPIARSGSDRAFGMATLANRLQAAGALQEGVTPARAADTLWTLTSFAAFDELYSGRGLDAAATTDTLLDLVRRAVLAPVKGTRDSSGLGDLELQFHGEVFHWRGPSPFHFVRVPEDAAGLIHALAPMVTYGWGVIPAEGRVGHTDFTTALFPKDGGYLVPIKDAIRKAEDLAIGDEVEILLVIRT